LIRVLIVDDEQTARERLQRLLAAFPNIEIVGEAGDGPDALAAIRSLQPDAVFLDIEMPGCSGTEVASSLPEPAPRIVFCTAWEKYAPEAFDLRAVDYLLKPVSRERLAESVRRLTEPPPPRPALPWPRRFLARDGDRYVVIPAAETICFTSSGGLTRLCTRQREYVLDPSLNDLEVRLDPALYFRLSRNAIVRLDEIRELHPMPGGAGEALLRDGRTLEVTRRRLQNLLEKLGKL
jgi:two-component system LytT family response regulator